MTDRKNEVEFLRHRIKIEHSKNFQNLLKKHPSIHLLNNPEINEKYVRFSFGGDEAEMNKFDNELYSLNYYYSDSKPEKKSLFKRFTNWLKGEKNE